jgi:hypothetical protein
MSTFTKDRDKDDPGQIILNPAGIPICSAHGDSLWIDEMNVKNNNALCLFSDLTINASPKVKLNRNHLSMKNMPDSIKDLSDTFHESIEEQKDA